VKGTSALSKKHGSCFYPPNVARLFRKGSIKAKRRFVMFTALTLLASVASAFVGNFAR
jgi:hypothetical protein